MSLVVRPERPSDHDDIDRVVRAAFARDGVGEPAEVPLLRALRSDTAFIRELSLVAEDDDAIVGYVIATRGALGRHRAVGIGPVAVQPTRQGEGTGSTLMRALLETIAARGESVAVLLGDAAFYSRFGFVPAADLGIAAPDPAWGTHFQAVSFGTWEYAASDGSTTFSYAAPFSDL